MAPQPSGFGKGKGKARPSAGLGLGMSSKRHRKVLRDTIRGITNSDIRRMARRGGVKRISAHIYNEARTALRQRLEVVLRDITSVLDLTNRKTVQVTDIVFVLNRVCLVLRVSNKCKHWLTHYTTARSPNLRLWYSRQTHNTKRNATLINKNAVQVCSTHHV